MAWRGLHISKPARLSLKAQRLVVEQGEEEPVSFPLEDVAWILLDTPQATATAAVMAACLQAGIPVVFSDERHTPCGVLLPFHQHWQQAGVARAQVAAGAALKKRMWLAIVRRKIENQAAILDRAQIEGGRTLREMTGHVRSGDQGNVEARAARFYWQRLFNDFRRHDESDLRNAMLNYGYAVLRAGVARGLVGAGLLPAFGIHHAGAQNAFNLADDLLEVIRPLADWAAFRLSGQGQRPEEAALSRDHRQELAAVMTEPLVVEGEQLTVLPAVDRMVSSLVRAISGEGATALVLPRV
ncbi:MAG: type II CRISPR-associated endonuclease Cas1 [Rhodovibrionaceae bacterium]